jgi:hypothetical protein
MGYFLVFQVAQATCFAQPHVWRDPALRKQDSKNRSRVLASGAAYITQRLAIFPTLPKLVCLLMR